PPFRPLEPFKLPAHVKCDQGFAESKPSGAIPRHSSGRKQAIRPHGGWIVSAGVRIRIVLLQSYACIAEQLGHRRPPDPCTPSLCQIERRGTVICIAPVPARRHARFGGSDKQTGADCESSRPT